MNCADKFVKMNNYVVACYSMACSKKNDIDTVVANRYLAQGAFEMFRMSYPDAFTDEQFDNFWNFYKEAFEKLYGNSLGIF